MRLFCCGFNLYGQFIKCPSYVITNFVECTYDDVMDFVPGLTYNLIITKEHNGISLHTSVEGKTHQIKYLELPENINCTYSSCIDNRILLLSGDGDLYKYDLQSNSIMPKPIKKSITKVASGNKITIALDKQGRIFNLPSQMEFTEQVNEIATGCEHCLLLTDSGNVYSFGQGSRGQLGHGNLDDETEPKLIKALEGIRIKKIAAGGWHSCAVSSEGDLYIWGWNSNGQLGIYENENDAVGVMATPQVVDFDNNLELCVVNVACGSRHTIALLNDQKLYGAGWNKYHQLAMFDQIVNVYKMRFLYDFSNRIIKDLKCGPWSSVVIVD